MLVIKNGIVRIPYQLFCKCISTYTDIVKHRYFQWRFIGVEDGLVLCVTVKGCQYKKKEQKGYCVFHCEMA